MTSFSTVHGWKLSCSHESLAQDAITTKTGSRISLCTLFCFILNHHGNGALRAAMAVGTGCYHA
ncbi:hypothetical protein BC936DRAFT_137519 [Jimgerdemannia flammicorona]|uniref:Uncharacterized protein n=1 Tax=Jimgerdemannia flammicorona TaxID=994334 RepID=A0A433CX70_9FUNG|nr:hypothetical protein BC936DRAFT_137519 [Jimgerdemannia flammicorona]